MINYNKYPLLLFTSYTKEDAPENLPFEVVSENVRNYLANTPTFGEMFAYIAVFNSIKKENTTTNFLLNDSTFHTIDSNEIFRNNRFRNFFSNYVKPSHGTIMFKEGGQYVYLLLGKHETKKMKKKNGRYIAVALFRENFFIGFEEAIITERGLEVMPTGHYENEMPVGGYISFAMITLAHADRSKPKIKRFENIEESILTL